MPRIGEIFSDGIEHAQRSLRKFGFKQQLKTAVRMKQRTLQAIGETAWRLRLEEGSSYEAWSELERTEREIALIHDETAKRTEYLREQMDEEREKHLELEAAGETADTDLEELAAKRASLLEEINKLERSLKDTEGADRELAEVHLSDIRATLNDIDTQIDAIQDRVNQTAANRHKLLRRTEQIEKQEQAALAEMAKRETELKKSSAPHYRALARQLLDNRPDRAELAPLYARYDLVTASAETTLRNIESERRLIELLDQESVVWFYGLCIGGGFAIIAILVLLLLWLVPALW